MPKSDRIPRILVVEDSRIQTLWIQRELEREGFEVELTSNAKDALKQAEKSSPDLILSDIRMPEMSGIELCRTIKADPKTQFIPLVLMTVLDDGQSKIDGIEAGADDFLQKPVNLQELKSRVRSLLRSKRLYEQVLESQKFLAMGNLTGGIAHNLINIMNGICLNLELVREDAKDQSVELLDAAYGAGKRVIDIIGQLVLFTRSEEKKEETFELFPLVEQIAAFCKSAFLGNDIEVECTVPEQPSKFTGDAAQIKQMLLNLCINSRDSLMESNATRRLVIQASFGNEGQYVIQISDTGTGINGDIRDQIFEPFFTTKANDEGIGLGLPVVRDIVQQHGGRVQLEDIPGLTTTFAVHLPMEGSLERNLTESGSNDEPRPPV